MNKSLVKIFSGLVLIVLLLAGCSGTQATPTVEPKNKTSFNPVISATGVVAPAQWATVAMPVSGLLVEVAVQEGQAVTEDMLLARIDGSEPILGKMSAARRELASARHDLDELISSAPALAAQAQQEIADAQRAVIKAERALAQTGEPAYQDKLSRAREEVIRLKDDLKTAQEDFDPYATWAEDNATRKSYQDRLDQAKRNYDEAVHQVDELILQKDQAQADLATANARLADAQKRYDRSKNGPDELDLAKAQAAVDSAQAGVAAAQAALDQLELHAPFAGVVSTLKVRQGEWINAGAPVLLLADMNSLRVETTDLNEIDAARVRLDDPVKVTFDALPGVRLDGRVARMALKSAEGSGVNYTVMVELKNPPAGLRWGMTAFVDIEVRE